MTNYTKWTIALVGLMVAVTGIVIWLIQDRLLETDSLTIQEASAKVEDLYGGTVSSFEETNNIYHIALKRNNQNYDFQIDPETGSILSLNKKDAEQNMDSSTQVKTKQEIRSLLNARNKGTIQSIKLQNSGDRPQYIVEATQQETLMKLVVDALTGEVISETAKEQNSADANKAPIITIEKAKQIALSQLNGTVEYVIYEAEEDGGYYLVEIEGDEEDVVYQIHAVSGKIISVTTEDEEDDESEDDEE